jgi:DNA gyrase/topoisomerase IV subunit B
MRLSPADPHHAADLITLSAAELTPAQLTTSLRVLLADGRGVRGREIIVRPLAPSVQDNALLERLDLLAALYPGLRLALEQGEARRVFSREGGLPGYLQGRIGDAAGRLPAVARFSAEAPCEQGGVLRAEVALQWLVDAPGSVLSVVNDAPTPGHGTPLQGLATGLSRALEEEGLDRDLLHYGMPALTGKRVLTGVAAVLKLEHPTPLYSSPSRAALSSRDAAGLFEQLIYRKARALFAETPGLIEVLLTKALGVPVGKPGEWRARQRLDEVA